MRAVYRRPATQHSGTSARVRLRPAPWLAAAAVVALAVGAYWLGRHNAGIGGVPPAQSAEAMVATVVDHVKKGNTSLQKVMFVLYQDEAFKAFSDALRRLAGAA